MQTHVKPRKKSANYRNTIWQLAQGIASGYKDAGQDHLSRFWVLRKLVGTFSHANHERFADITLEKMAEDRKNKKQILMEAFAQIAAESRKRSGDLEGWVGVDAIFRDNERPSVVSNPKKDPIFIAVVTDCACKPTCTSKCDGSCGCKHCERRTLLREKLGERRVTQ
jgi:hypothetical protein